MRRVTRSVSLALWLGSGVAVALPAGDPTPGSLAPLVVIVNPMGGATVGTTIRVQARVQHPSGPSAISGVWVSVSGAGGEVVALAPNARYALANGAGIYEAIVPLAVGSHELVASALDGVGRETSSTAVAVTVTDARGDGNLLVTDDSSQLCTACHGEADHGSEALGRAYGAWTTTCRDCHTPHATVNASLVRETIVPPWFAGAEPPPSRPVRFSTRAGFAAQGGLAAPAAASFTNADGSGLCQACHTRTSRWRADGAADSYHRGSCDLCHRHQAAFQPMACTDCHPVPPATGAHARHSGPTSPQPPFPTDPRPLGCGNCHPTDPSRHANGVQDVALNPSVVLPGGTVTSNPVLSGRAGSRSCLVACHYPMNSPRPAAPIAWSAAGPLPCRSCHARIDPSGVAPTVRAGPTLHDPVFSEARPASGEPTTCWSCHDAAAHDGTHLTGAPGLLASGSVNAVCVACHTPPSGPAAGPQGQVLHAGTDAATSRTPPVLPGWTETTVDASSGDFHGGRRGTCYGPNGPAPCAPAATPTGYGGTLKAPYARGQAAMACAACHAGHASGNAFLFADTVNGKPIPAGTIDRTGVGAEALCEACHEGQRHERCMACHTDAYYCDQNAQCWMDGAANHIDPAGPGSACFFCHGHEGIRRWTQPGPDMELPFDDTCQHCHGGFGANGGRPPTSVPPRSSLPRLTSGPAVTAVSWTGATLAWTTDVACSTWVEYGVGMPGYVTGDAAEATSHSVTLTGLTPGTSYVWRIRSVDAYRNAVVSSVATLSTPPPGTPATLDLVPAGWTGGAGVGSITLPLQWYEVAGPGGHALEYRVQLGSDPAFTGLANGSPRDSGWVSGIAGSLGGRPTRAFVVTLTNLPPDDCMSEPVPSNTYYWRVKARDAVTGVESSWSVVDEFHGTSWDPGNCGY